jgi:hypothetical protein
MELKARNSALQEMREKSIMRFTVSYRTLDEKISIPFMLSSRKNLRTYFNSTSMTSEGNMQLRRSHELYFGS